MIVWVLPSHFFFFLLFSSLFFFTFFVLFHFSLIVGRIPELAQILFLLPLYPFSKPSSRLFFFELYQLGVLRPWEELAPMVDFGLVEEELRPVGCKPVGWLGTCRPGTWWLLELCPYWRLRWADSCVKCFDNEVFWVELLTGCMRGPQGRGLDWVECDSWLSTTCQLAREGFFDCTCIVLCGRLWAGTTTWSCGGAREFIIYFFVQV